MKSILCLSLALLSISIVPANSATYTVRPDGLGDFATIQAALNAAQEGDSILLADGRFTGSGNTHLSYPSRNIVLRSASDNPKACVIDCEHLTNGITMGANLLPAALLRGITIENGVGHMGGAVYIDEYSSPSIEHCIFRNNSTDFAGGAVETGFFGLSPVTDCTFEGNSTVWGGGGICAADSRPLLTGCTFFGNSAIYGSAFYTEEEVLELQNCVMVGNTGGPATFGPPGTVTCCNLFDNSAGDWVEEVQGLLGQYGNISADPRFCNAPGGDFSLAEDSPCAPAQSGGCGRIGAWGVGCVAPASSVAELEEATPRLSVTPNPATREFRISCRVAVGGPVTVELLSAAGRRIRSIFEGRRTVGLLRVDFDATELPAGVYFVRVREAGTSRSERVVVCR